MRSVDLSTVAVIAAIAAVIGIVILIFLTGSGSPIAGHCYAAVVAAINDGTELP